MEEIFGAFFLTKRLFFRKIDGSFLLNRIPMESAGMNVIRSNATRKRAIIGIAFLAILITGTSVSELATNRLTPIGGVTNPIAQVDNHNDAELNRIDSDGFHNWKQDRRENQNGRRGIHDHADQQKECIDYAAELPPDCGNFPE